MATEWGGQQMQRKWKSESWWGRTMEKETHGPAIRYRGSDVPFGKKRLEERR